MYRLFLLTSACFLLMASCEENRPKQPRTNAVVQEFRTDTAKEHSNYTEIRDLNRYIKMPLPAEGVDSMQIRIWYNHSLGIYKRLLLIEYADDKWRGRIYEVTTDMSSTPPYLILQEYKSHSVRLKSSWDHVMAELADLKIADLPGHSEYGGTDGYYYSVEVLTNHKYIYYDYSVPKDLRHKYWHAENMVRVIELVEQAFDFSFEPRD